MTKALDFILSLCSRGIYRFQVPANIVNTWDYSLLKDNVLTKSANHKVKVPVKCCGCLGNVIEYDSRFAVICPECGEEAPLEVNAVALYDFNIENIQKWFDNVRRGLTSEEFSRVVEVFPKIINPKSSSLSKKPTRRGRTPRINIDDLPCRIERFGYSRDWSVIRDLEHKEETAVYEGIGPCAGLEVIKVLLNNIGKKDEGWIKSEPTWHNSFQSDVLKRFKREQIETGKNRSSHHGMWRIIPTKLFDSMSPVGKFHKRQLSAQ